MTWETARRALYPLGQWGGFTTEPVRLDWMDGPCVACGEPAMTGYEGRPFHAICAIELAIYAMLVKRGERPGLRLSSGFVLDSGSADALQLPVGR